MERASLIISYRDARADSWKQDSARELGEQTLVQANAGEEVFDWEIFVRRVGAAIRERESEEKNIGAECLLEVLQNRDRPALADQRDFTAESLDERALRGF